jgi:hypothetical protein
MVVAGKLGKLDPQRSDNLSDITAYMGKILPAGPPSVDYTVGVANWEMALNDQYGDCTIATVTHMDKAWSHQTNEAYSYPGDQDIQNTYFGLSGGQDSGLVEADVLSAWKNTGLFGRKIVGYAPVNIRDIRTMKSALHLFGGLYVGVQVPAIAQNQFEQGKEWNPTGNPVVDRNIEGGHAIPLLGYFYENNNLHFKCITWGAVQVLTGQWWKMYADEAWAIIPAEYMDAAASMGINIQSLEADLPLVQH